MRKVMVIFALTVLVVWGVYDVYADQDKTNSSKEKPAIGLEKGNMAPDFALNTLQEDKILRLSDLRGKKVILNMWASWCPPCVEEMPDLQAYYMDHQAEGIEVLAINLTEAEQNIDDVARFAESFELTFPIGLDKRSTTADLYQVTTIPTSYIIDTKGRIVHKVVGPMTYESLSTIMEQVE